MNESLVVQQPKGRAAVLVLLLHGVGATAADLLPLGRRVATAMPWAMVVSVSAPQASDMGRGTQWFSVLGVTEGNRPGRVAQAMTAFEATLSHWQTAAGLGPEGTALVGFSQGSIMALESTQGPASLASQVVAIAGRFAQPPRKAPAGATVHLLHGEQDAVIPAAQSRDAAARLHQLGASVTLDLFAGLGHAIDARVAGRVVERLLERSHPSGAWMA